MMLEWQRGARGSRLTFCKGSATVAKLRALIFEEALCNFVHAGITRANARVEVDFNMSNRVSVKNGLMMMASGDAIIKSAAQKSEADFATDQAGSCSLITCSSLSFKP